MKVLRLGTVFASGRQYAQYAEGSLGWREHPKARISKLP